MYPKPLHPHTRSQQTIFLHDWARRAIAAQNGLSKLAFFPSLFDLYF
ncbi:MAG: hypothetical protein KAF91_01125 [Nostoc sp. TH1S01]|nr:hypothetical protein [Nostoc sp. TH1S01]